RGTVSLLFSCIVTLVLCVWTALHLNVEPLEFSRSKIAGASRVIGKIIWGFAALIVPEVVLSIALHQFLVARRYQTLLEMTEQPDEIADLGQPGSAINSAKDVSRYNSPPVSLPANEVPAPQSVHQNPLDDNTAATVAKIQQYPSAAIEDKSKADYLAKLLACIQAGWILLQCLGRKLSDLPITLLELNTVLHVLNAFVMYTLWWKKPLDVSQPSIIDQLERIETKKVFVINRESRSLWKQLVATLTDGGRHVSNQIIWVPGLFDDGSNEMLSSFGATWCAIHRIIVMLFAVFTGSFYGGMHSLKWYDVFPTAMEQKLWRISTLVGAVGIIPLVAFAMIFLRIQRIRNSQPAEWISWIVVILFWICASLFLVARVFLVVESFISMRAVSEDSYKTVQWAEVLPHF
ncbi:hypothetical protein EDC01DRAFT_593838, partial [Geopyxis carbonaria]